MTPALPGTECRRRVYLMRHGAVSYFDADGRPLDPRAVSLTQEGRAQVESVAELLKELPIDRAICSGMPRTRETAEIAIGGRDLPIEDVPDLKEIRLGRFRDVPEDQRERILGRPWDLIKAGEDAIAGGEPFTAFEARVYAGWDAILNGPPWTTLLLVAHDAVNRVLLAWASGAGLSSIGAFEQDMACLNVLDIDMRDAAVERAMIRAVNITPYDLAKNSIHLTSMEQVYRQYRGD